MMLNRTFAALSLCSLLSMNVTAGENFIEGERTFAADAEVGGSLTTGNSESSSIRGALEMRHELGNWENSYLLQALYSENKDQTDGSVSRTQTYEADAQGNYLINERSYLFANGNYYRDPSTGYQYTVTTSAGYGYRIYETKVSSLDFEIGPGYQYQKLSGTELSADGEDHEDSFIVHSVVDFQHRLSETSKFQQRFVADYGDKLLASSETSLTANIVGALAMKLALVVRYDNEPLLDKKSTDTETNLTLLYSF